MAHLKTLIVVYCGNGWIHKYIFFKFKPGGTGSNYYALKN